MKYPISEHSAHKACLKVHWKSKFKTFLEKLLSVRSEKEIEKTFLRKNFFINRRDRYKNNTKNIKKVEYLVNHGVSQNLDCFDKKMDFQS